MKKEIGIVGSRNVGSWKCSQQAQLTTTYPEDMIKWINQQAAYHNVPAAVIIRKSVEVYKQLVEAKRKKGVM